MSSSSSFPTDFTQISSDNLLQATMPIPMSIMGNQQFHLPEHSSESMMMMAMINGNGANPQSTMMGMPNCVGSSTFLLATGEVPILSLPNPHFNEISQSNPMQMGMPIVEENIGQNIRENIPSKIQGLIKERQQQSSSKIANIGISGGTKNRKKFALRNSNSKHHLRTKMKPYSSVERRNARERNRVHTVNQAFHILKRMIPSLSKNTKRVSKLKILRACIQYVYQLLEMMEEEENTLITKNLMHWKFGY